MATLAFISFLILRDGFYEMPDLTYGWDGAGACSYCGGIVITGGYNAFGGTNTGQRTIQLPEHDKIQILMNIYVIDSWDYERMLLRIDGQPKLDNYYLPGPINLCGQYYGDNNVTYDSGWINHTNPSIFIQVSSFLDSSYTDESLGWTTKIKYWVNHCFKFYTQINYQGDEYKFCKTDPSEHEMDILAEIRSLKVPDGAQLKLQGPDFNNGILTTFTSDQPNLGQPFKFPKRIKIP